MFFRHFKIPDPVQIENPHFTALLGKAVDKNHAVVKKKLIGMQPAVRSFRFPSSVVIKLHNQIAFHGFKKFLPYITVNVHPRCRRNGNPFQEGAFSRGLRVGYKINH